MRSPASSTSPRAPSKPTLPASCESSAPETASRSPCGPTRPAASDTAEAPAAACRTRRSVTKRRVPLGEGFRSWGADQFSSAVPGLLSVANRTPRTLYQRLRSEVLLLLSFRRALAHGLLRPHWY